VEGWNKGELGASEGALDRTDGMFVVKCEGTTVGLFEENFVIKLLGNSDGMFDGDIDGAFVIMMGCRVGFFDGLWLGNIVGI